MREITNNPSKLSSFWKPAFDTSVSMDRSFLSMFERLEII